MRRIFRQNRYKCEGVKVISRLSHRNCVMVSTFWPGIFNRFNASTLISYIFPRIGVVYEYTYIRRKTWDFRSHVLEVLVGGLA